MPPSPRSLLWPTMEMPRKLYFSVESPHEGLGPRSPGDPLLPSLVRTFHTHVECDRDDVEGHRGIGDTAEGGGLWRGDRKGGARSSTTRRQAPASGSLGPTSPKEPHPLHARRPLLPPPSVALEEAGGAALLGGAAEPDSNEKRGVGGASGQEASTTRLTRGRRRGALGRDAGTIPTHGVILIRIAQAGTLQLTGHEGGGTLVPSQVALQP